MKHQSCAWCSAPAEFRPIVVVPSSGYRAIGGSERAVCLFHKQKLVLVFESFGEPDADGKTRARVEFKLAADVPKSERASGVLLDFVRHTSAAAIDADARMPR